ncbi:MAG: single-stranded DNA-binding protein [Candidatus Moranbacteria bacterium]|nr:single-stranded DNA-binding protein [Candidatus Moranbacteria bacterium]
MNVNKVILVGRLTRDPEIRTTPGGQSVATISMATNSFWTDKSGQKQDKTEYHNVVLWGRQAEIASQYLTKGQECFIEGRLQTRAYTGKDGVERRTTEVIGETMQLGSRAQGGSAQQGGGSTPRTYNSAPASAPRKTESQLEEESIPTINLDDEVDEIRIEDVPF